MREEVEILLACCQEQWEQARHTEDQRSVIGNLIIVTASVIVGFVAQQGFTWQMMPLSAFVVLLGGFGALTTRKLYEVFHLHHDKAIAWQAQIDRLVSEAKLNSIESDAWNRHNTNWPTFSKRVRLNAIWQWLFLIVSAVGFVLIAIILFTQVRPS